MAVDSITAADALAVLEPIWTAKPETASRVRQRMETVLDWAVSHGYRLDNPAGRSLLKVLPAVKRLKQHHPSLPYEQVPAALDLVRHSKCQSADQAGLRVPGADGGPVWRGKAGGMV
jgi:integrase